MASSRVLVKLGIFQVFGATNTPGKIKFRQNHPTGLWGEPTGHPHLCDFLFTSINSFFCDSDTVMCMSTKSVWTWNWKSLRQWLIYWRGRVQKRGRQNQLKSLGLSTWNFFKTSQAKRSLGALAALTGLHSIHWNYFCVFSGGCSQRSRWGCSVWTHCRTTCSWWTSFPSTTSATDTGI